MNESANIVMATIDASLCLEGLEKYNALSEQIETTFIEFHSLLERKKFILLEKVRESKELYQKHRDLEKSIKQLEEMKKAANDILTENLIAENKGQVVSLWDDKIEELLRNKASLDCVVELKFVSNSAEISNCVGKIHLRDCDTLEFCERREPLIMKGTKTGVESGIVNLRGAAVDSQTSQVFVVDNYNSIVSVYSLEGDFEFCFGKGKLSSPYGICVSEKFVFVTNLIHSSICKFSKCGEFLSEFKSKCVANEFEYLVGVCVHNELVYVCNRGKNRIDIISLDMVVVESFGSGYLDSPEDINVHDNTIYVLTHRNNSIYSFTTELSYISCIHLTGQLHKIYNSYFFTIDLNGNFIISEKCAGCLKVFTPTGEYLDSLGDAFLNQPQGLVVDCHDRIISISNSRLNCLQIY